MLLHNLGPNNHAIGNIHQQIQHHIHGQKSLGQDNPTNRTIIQRPLKPLIGMRIRRTGRQAHNVPAERTAPLRPHGIALVRHGRTSNLILGERFLHLLQIREQSNVAAHFVRRLRNAAQQAQHVVIDLARVSLSANGNTLVEPHLTANLLIQRLDLIVIAIEQFQKRGLRPRRALDTPHGQILQLVRHPLVIQQQILHPERAPLAHRGELRRLIVRESQRRHILVLEREFLEDGERLDELLAYQLERFLELDDVRVVPDVAGGGAQVNDGHGLGRHVSEGVDVSHDVVAEFGFEFGSLVEVDGVEIVLHLLELFVGNVDAEFLFRGGECEP
mmetsp:Transcript_28981/g.61717  ORF Transcript_28981/g.61717 Transcript_28981/m.61717 type:complete len:331 (-) Transcript_28981:270-1262(-)